MLDGLTRWLSAGRMTDILKATINRDIWKAMIVKAEKQGF